MEVKRGGNDACFDGQKVILRPLRKDLDLENCWRWINDPEVAKFLLIVSPIDFGFEEEWFSKKYQN
ncbi:MAG: hypothetical protein COU81_02375 [Candidatus Portnoybacteria bacterium CG10_big_fil_rev_8_21_14_0_10_36_7]|uniref:Uncharacterized protein n=1 Tax=Candidatus Portnoybacteria bacterium CG10_big_fil_rev_8_21_14_0_10_36_7 TaxID=1974812 RepID=A0A2M8KDY2_9BACT|nr:MAG: hypothetical protein COU81_02375 [Candidatus Portnoybacteria bacterium CG10_big_fil_rev_8_21_14_0_10_36_7]